MTGFINAANNVIRNLRAPQRKISAVMLMLALLTPITAPIPAWAYDLNLPRTADDGLRLTAPGSSPFESSLNIFGGLFNNLAAFISPSMKKDKESEKTFNKEALERTVKGIETQIGDKQTVRAGQILSLAAIPVDKNNSPVNGLAPNWESSNPQVLKIINDSQAIALKSGDATLTVSSGKFTREFSVNVISSVVAAHVSNRRTETAAMPSDDDDEFRSSLTPENNLGSPSGQVEAQAPNAPAALGRRRYVERIGSANFNFDVPVAVLPGRGIEAGINLSYNSRIWNYWQNPIAPQLSRYRYNMDGDWLAPGFKLTFGGLNLLSKTLTSPDGTRHQLYFISGDTYNSIYETTDGTFIRVHITKTSQNYINNTAIVKYPDGLSVTYTSLYSGVHHTKFSPTKITDRNGNVNQIAYKQNDTSGRIWYIRDTLNRYINFHYDSSNKLVAVTVPGFDGGSERQTVRFYYETMNFDTTTPRFQGVNHSIPPSAEMLKYVYFPGTNSGFKYEYSPAWGMIYKISNLRGMQISENVVSPDSLTQTGTVISDGQVAATTEYSYPLTLATPLNDVPKYTTRTDDWAGRTTAQAAVTTYQVEKDTVNDRTLSKIKSPDGTITETWAKIAPNSWDDGLVTDTFIKTLLSLDLQTYKTWAHTKLFWTNQTSAGGRQNPRVTKIEQTNEANLTKATAFEYDIYNNQTVVKVHDFAAPNALGTELRKTEIIYETRAGWINNRLTSLPTLAKTTVNGAVVSKTVFEYDNDGGGASSNLVARTDIDPQTHDRRYNWSNGSDEVCTWNPDTLEEECNTVWVYDSATDYRGNITKTTAFSDATLTSDLNASVSTIKYDVAGNSVESSSSCCELKTTQYSNINHYAYPMSETRNGGGLQMTTSVTYDLNTGLVKTATDENNQTSTLTYNPSHLRLIRTDSPNGAWQTTEYNDASFPYHVKSTASLDAARSVSSWSFSNGRGQGFRQRSQTANGYISSDVEFDNMVRAVKSYSPYTVTGLNDNRPGDIKFSETVQRDGLGRTLQSRLPDLTTVNASYNGVVTTATDQAGKQRRQITDALGRTARVDEPDATGNLGDINSPVQPTYYEYDGNDNLTKVTQTGSGATQERLFKYDSLSRLTHERQVEATATLDSNGVKIGAGGLWTGVYKHDSDSLLLEGFDARGVKTAITYDGLNRIKTVTYTGETGYQTPTVTYTYDETETGFYNNGRLSKVKTAANETYGTPETIQNYRYDKIGQVTKHIQSIGNQNYQLEYGYNLAGQLTSEKYPSGKVVNMTVDNFGVMQTIANSQRTYLNGVSINNQGLLSQLNLGNGTNETFGYNDRFQMTSQSLQRGSEVLQKYDYGYGQTDLATGNVDATKNNGQLGKIEGFIGANKQWSQRFGYDELGRLSEAGEYKQGDNTQLTYKQKFDFDRFGNLYRKAANNPIAGQQNPLAYTPIEDSDINKSTNRFATGTTYNEAGQVVTDNKFRNMNFAYDANGRQVKATRASVPDAWTVYDALGNRVATKINDVWQYVIYDAFGKLVAEYGIASEGLGGVKYFQQDWQGSVRTITSNTGFIVARTDHQAFGEVIGNGVGMRSSQQGYAANVGTRQSYGLTENDDGSGQQHTWFRKLETQSGRWSSPDPYKGSMSLGNPQSFNRYSYVENDPTNSIDPSGLFALIERGWDGWWSGSEYRFFTSRAGGSRGGGGGGQSSSGRGGGNPSKDKKPDCPEQGFSQDITPVNTPLVYTAAELNDAAATVFGEISPNLHPEIAREARAVASEIFNRSFDPQKYRATISSLSAIASAPVQFAGYNKGRDDLKNFSANPGGANEFREGERNCTRYNEAVKAVKSIAEDLRNRDPYLHNRAVRQGSGRNAFTRRLQPGQVRIGGNDFSVNPM